VNPVLGMRKQRVLAVVSGLVALKVALLFALAWNRRIVMDEFEQLGWAKYLGHGFFTTIWPAKAVGYAIFFDVAHLIGWDARSILLIGRMQTALLACGTLAITYASARSLGVSKARSALIVLILLSFSNFIERIFETRGDPLSVFFGAAALLVTLQAGGRAKWILAAGVLSGLAFLSTQKAVYFNAALGVALIGDAALARRYAEGVARGVWLVLGWLVPVVVYCFAFGGANPLAVAQNLIFGPAALASSQMAAEYGGLGQFVVQTLARNALLYLFCFAGMVLALLRLPDLHGSRPVALIFSVIVTALVFAHNQPWPYVFIMALPFIALWALEPFDALSGRWAYRTAAWGVLGVAVLFSFVRNVQAFRIDNHAQLALVERAEKLTSPEDVYFDGIGMLPNRREPSTLWLDRHTILQTLREGRASEAWRIFAQTPPKVILWTYRMDGIRPVAEPLIRDSYVQVAPNIRMAGAQLGPGGATTFNVRLPGRYALYDLTGRRVPGALKVNGRLSATPVNLLAGPATLEMPNGPVGALLLPEGAYVGQLNGGSDNKTLFDDVYN
jgi:hypothetical protein